MLILRFCCSILVLLTLSLPSFAQDETPAPTGTPLPIPTRPLPAASATSVGLTYERFFAAMIQGQVGLLRLSGVELTEARALFRGREYPFVPHDDGWYVLLVADIDAQPREYPLSVIARIANGEIVTYEDRITIESGGYIRQNFDVPSTLGYLINPEVERNEYARLDALIAEIQPDPLWGENGWTLPMDAPITAPFGDYRILNQVVQTRHTGWDQSAPVGTPVGAMADGVVAFAGRLEIRGNYVLIDHGWGIYTGYAHFSQINVQRGQRVEKGQIIGSSGNTGRSNGPHLHWEIAVNGEWVDGLQFLETWLP